MTECSEHAQRYSYTENRATTSQNLFSREVISKHQQIYLRNWRALVSGLTNEIDFFEWFAVYDFEALLLKIQKQGTDKLQWKNEHRPISVSVCSNVDGFLEPICFVNENLDSLLSDMVTYLKQISDAAKTLRDRKWNSVHKRIDELIERYTPVSQNQTEDSQQKAYFQSPTYIMYNQLKKIETQVPSVV